jgi:hypothetical protein
VADPVPGLGITVVLEVLDVVSDEVPVPKSFTVCAWLHCASNIIASTPSAIHHALGEGGFLRPEDHVLIGSQRLVAPFMAVLM